MLGGDKPGGPAWMKWALLGAGAVILALVFALLTQDKPDPTPQKPPAQQAEAPQKKPTSWSQNYSTTVRYGANALTISSVKVSRLNKQQSKVSYQALLRNSRGKVSWIREKGRFLIRSPGVKAPPTSIQVTKVGAQYRLKINFSWPRKRLYYGSSLEANIPGQGVTEQLLLGLEVPRDNQNIEARKGVSGLTR